jgi:hypothetical protein
VAGRKIRRGNSDPLPALKLALSQNVQLIYLLADGAFADNERGHY